MRIISSNYTKRTPFDAQAQYRTIEETSVLVFIYYEAEGGVLKLLETGAPYAPHVKWKITWKRKLEFLLTHSVWNGIKVVCTVFRQVLE